MKTAAAKSKARKPTSRRGSTTMDITANKIDVMLPRIQAEEAIETMRGGLDGLDDKWMMITMPQMTIISIMQLMIETKAVLCFDQNVLIAIIGISSYLLAMDSGLFFDKCNRVMHQRLDGRVTTEHWLPRGQMVTRHWD